MYVIANNNSDVVTAIVVGTLAGIALVAVIAYQIRELVAPRRLGGRLKRFFGRSLATLQAHDKQFPGYDLASLSRALTAFFDAHAAHVDRVGCVHIGSVQELLSMQRTEQRYRMKPAPPVWQRLPIDVEQEESFISNCLYFARLRPLPGETGAADEPLIVRIAQGQHMNEYDEDMNSQYARATTIDLSIACTSRAVADFFFSALEDARRRLSIYRGKVIDPVINAAGIQTIAFRRIQAVAERDLILPDSVKSLLHGAIVAFYENHQALRALGVELKRGILFHSPPGTGKTSISLYLAGLLPNFTVCFVSGKRLLHPREICRMARYLQPTMLVFEDIDLIAQERDLNGLATVLGELMNQIDGCEPNEQVLFIMNTNSMDRIEQAVRNRPGRVDQIIHIPLPDARDRRRLLELFSSRFVPTADDLDRAAAATDGATPAMLKEIVKRAAVSAIAQVAPSSNGRPIQITAQDLLLAYHQVQHLREMKSPASEVL